MRINIASHQPDLVHVGVRLIEGFPSCITHLNQAGAKRARVTQSLHTADTQISIGIQSMGCPGSLSQLTGQTKGTANPSSLAMTIE